MFEILASKNVVALADKNTMFNFFILNISKGTSFIARNSDRESTIVYNVLGLADGAEKVTKTERCPGCRAGPGGLAERLHFSNCANSQIG
jgi:hypothetical protein